MTTPVDPMTADLLRRLTNLALGAPDLGWQLGVRILGARRINEGGELLVSVEAIEGPRRPQVYALTAIGWEPFHVVDGRERAAPIAPRIPVEARPLSAGVARRLLAKAEAEAQGRADLRARRKEQARTREQRARLAEIKLRDEARAARRRRRVPVRAA